jgi:hypothetical protein
MLSIYPAFLSINPHIDLNEEMIGCIDRYPRLRPGESIRFDE